VTRSLDVVEVGIVLPVSGNGIVTVRAPRPIPSLRDLMEWAAGADAAADGDEDICMDMKDGWIGS